MESFSSPQRNEFTMDELTIAIGLGLIISFWFSEAFGLSAGGLIAPGYLAMSLGSPSSVALTLVAAVFTWALVACVGRHAILFGRRRVLLMMLVGFAVAATARFALTWMAGPEIALQTEGASAGNLSLGNLASGLTVIGFVIPGLIALGIDRVGAIPTFAPLVAATTLVYLTLISVGLTVL